MRQTLVAAVAYGDGGKGGRPPYDSAAMFKVLILAAQNNVSEARMEYLIHDRLSWMRFLGFDLGAATPDANTIRMFRERLTAAHVGTLEDRLHPLLAKFLEERQDNILDRSVAHLVRTAMARHDNNQVKAAAALGVTRNVLRTHLKNLNLI